jgi:hypothetical protein
LGGGGALCFVDDCLSIVLYVLILFTASSYSFGCHDITEILLKVALNTVNQTYSFGIFILFLLNFLQ